MWALRHDKIAVVDVLLEHKAKVGFRNRVCTFHDVFVFPFRFVMKQSCAFRSRMDSQL